MDFTKKCKLSRTEMEALRDEGYSYAKIAKESNISRQRVFQLIGGAQKNKTPKPLHKTECIYPNLRQYMNKNHISRMSLVRKIYGETNSRLYNRVNRFLNGDSNKYIDKFMLDGILRVTGLTYEQLFAEH